MSQTLHRIKIFAVCTHNFTEEVIKYWTEHGVSIFHSARVLIVMEMLKERKIETKISGERRRPVHAKIYKGDNAITIGSSNFSGAGMTWQMEGNARFTKSAEAERFQEAGDLAEYFWNSGQDFKLENLLKLLLQNVTWQEALARACAEVLEGDWAVRYLAANPIGDLSAHYGRHRNLVYAKHYAFCKMSAASSWLMPLAQGKPVWVRA